MKRYRILFKGRVQGVGFRFTAKMIADRLNLTGSVKNLYNYDVESYVQGEVENIERFIYELQNQRFIRIESIDKTEVDTIQDENSFDIIG
ncbi:acylphosphatase [Anaerococcus sp. Marseille-Q7828]|uniref:acylphosphatase n=1 Tax=Anaerococcus sp. Marseille-Q7828 TaxID=3036300 RepID=UPI0024AC88AC|nr:acylphosphatase [Anaerococcus sp. Marseille-Q7828]